MADVTKFNIAGTDYTVKDPNAYVKPSRGIPSTDLAQSVNDALDAAGNAIKGVVVNGSEVTPDSTTKKVTLTLVDSRFANRLIVVIDGVTVPQNTQVGGIYYNSSTNKLVHSYADGATIATENINPSSSTIYFNLADLKFYSWSGSAMVEEYVFGGIVGISTDGEGSLVFAFANGDTYTVNLNHDHPQYALKSEMSVTAGTGANADKTTIQLKSGTSATVLTSHQSLSGYAKYWTGTQAEYEALSPNYDSGTIYLIQATQPS